ncbi:hypothetical protein DESC_610398 [Desulfosarcina cetonica]|nr:hypothetical protein DESC_610398 [Desulfosarcina cetonica]
MFSCKGFIGWPSNYFRWGSAVPEMHEGMWEMALRLALGAHQAQGGGLPSQQAQKRRYQRLFQGTGEQCSDLSQ